MRIASSSNDATVRLWNVDGTGEPLLLRASNAPVNTAFWSPTAGVSSRRPTRALAAAPPRR